METIMSIERRKIDGNRSGIHFAVRHLVLSEDTLPIQSLDR
jgi:hypothetical protein